jgi:hypothetical protein
MLTNKQVLNWSVCSDLDIVRRIKTLKKERAKICKDNPKLADKIIALREFENREFPIHSPCQQ